MTVKPLPFAVAVIRKYKKHFWVVFFFCQYADDIAHFMSNLIALLQALTHCYTICYTIFRIDIIE